MFDRLKATHAKIVVPHIAGKQHGDTTIRDGGPPYGHSADRPTLITCLFRATARVQPQSCQGDVELLGQE